MRFLNLNNKQKLIVIFILIIFFVVGTLVIVNNKNNSSKQNQSLITPESNKPISVDPSVKVEVIPLNLNKEINLKITNIPDGTKEIEYIISYNTEDGGLQGVNSVAEIKGNLFEKKITLGTCSSGTCVYHKVKDKIKVELSFRGDYGERYFENEYNLNK
jgi:hypothetical protein